MPQEEKSKSKEGEVIGRASATERDVNSSEKFSFWLRPGFQVNPFDIVEAEHIGGATYGLVKNINHLTDSPSHLSNFIANDFGESIEEPNTPRQGTNVAEASVLANTENNYMPVQNENHVRFADEQGIQTALGIGEIREKEEEEKRPLAVPAGIIEMSNGTKAVVSLDLDYVIGPEGAHVNISGISGLATKTSYIVFLIQSILQTLNRKVGEGSNEIHADKVATIIMNVKKDDLLTIDQLGETSIPQDQQEMWNKMGLKPQPFSNVTYFLPVGKNTERAKKPNTHGQFLPSASTKLYAYEFLDTVKKLPLLFSNVPDAYGTMSAILGELERAFSGLKPDKDWEPVKTWNNFLEESPLAKCAREGEKYRDIRADSIGRFLRYVRKARQRGTGLLIDGRRQSDWNSIEELISEIKGGHTYVVDIARLTEEEQALVFGDVIKTVYQLFTESDVPPEELPRKVLIFVDELNKYAPADGYAPLLDNIIDIAERGRSWGIILLSAQQAASRVHQRVWNMSTNVYGRTDVMELGAQNYRFIDPEIKSHLTRLNKGELILRHARFRDKPIKIRFPRPVFKQSR